MFALSRILMMSHIQDCCGTSGQEAVSKASTSLRMHGLSIELANSSPVQLAVKFMPFDNNYTREYTTNITTCSSFDKEDIQRIFDENTYLGWAPLALDSCDQAGDRLVGLIPITKMI